jgi:mitogen-activated protein kinase organizer 1
MLITCYLGSFDTTVKIWDGKSNSSKPIMTLSDAKDSISCLAVADAEIFVGSVDGRVRIYDIRMGRLSVDVIGRMSSMGLKHITPRNDSNKTQILSLP